MLIFSVGVEVFSKLSVGAGDVAQLVEHFLSMHEALGSFPSSM